MTCKKIKGFFLVKEILPLFFLAFLAISCHREPSEQVLKEKAHQVALEYLIHETSIDSIQIIAVEKITEEQYAKIMLELLENMSFEYEILYENALENRDEQQKQSLLQQKEEIENVKMSLLNKINEKFLNSKKTFLYFISAEEFEFGDPTQILLFMTTKYKLYEMDPFENNLIK
ncbi:MAG: hypothetical protein LBU51_03845 [Bacteroidales bacterium]|nr:hypothetical protein [Bacteroidales bacterium]